MASWRFIYETQSWSDAERLVIVRDLPNGRKAIIQPVVMEVVERGVFSETATLEVPRVDVEDGLGGVKDFMQAAMDTAYAMGLWPTHAPLDSSAELSAVRYHLEDMRKLAKVKT